MASKTTCWWKCEHGFSAIEATAVRLTTLVGFVPVMDRSQMHLELHTECTFGVHAQVGALEQLMHASLDRMSIRL